MSRADVDFALRGMRRQPTGPAAAALRAELRGYLAEPWVDGALAAAIRSALGPGAPAWTGGPLRVGETWLLLASPVRATGQAVRWRSVPHAPDDDAVAAQVAGLVEEAWLGLAACLGASHRGLPADFRRGTFVVPALAADTPIGGGSLGVAAALGWLSRALGAPLPSDLAATAGVTVDGALARVGHVAEKLAALREAAPSVRRVIVAPEDAAGAVVTGAIELLPCRTLAEALGHAGLPLDALPACPVEDLEHRVQGFQRENSHAHGTERWRALSHEAWSIAKTLEGVPAARATAQRAGRWAVLFALHAGDDLAARRIARGDEDVDDPAVRLWSAVVAASAAVDAAEFDAARELALLDAALEARGHLAADHRWIEGHARAGRGRVLLFAGDFAAAIAATDAAVAWFRAESMAWEAGRSLLTKSACLRLSGRAADALATLDEARDALAASAGLRAEVRKTRQFLALERGRALLALGEPVDAAAEFESVEGAADRDYPRLGALRGLACARHALGRGEEGRRLRERCLLVARALPAGSTLGRTAAMARAEAADDDPELFARHAETWRRHFGEAEPAAVRARFVY